MTASERQRIRSVMVLRQQLSTKAVEMERLRLDLEAVSKREAGLGAALAALRADQADTGSDTAERL